MHAHLHVHRPDHRNLRVHVPGHGNRLFVDAAVLVVLHHAHDGHLVSPVVGADGVAQRILIGQKSLRKLFVDDADVGEVAVSESAKSRPASTGTPRVRKKSGPTTLLRTVLDAPLATSGTFPSTIMSLLSDHPDQCAPP